MSVFDTSAFENGLRFYPVDLNPRTQHTFSYENSHHVDLARKNPKSVSVESETVESVESVCKLLSAVCPGN